MLSTYNTQFVFTDYTHTNAHFGLGALRTAPRCVSRTAIAFALGNVMNVCGMRLLLGRDMFTLCGAALFAFCYTLYKRAHAECLCVYVCVFCVLPCAII